jgi:Cys-Gly metallodipeptidase DUG1
MDLPKISQQVVAFVHQEFEKLPSKNKCTVKCVHDGKYWLSDVNHWNYGECMLTAVAGAKAISAVYGTEPDFTREGGSIPVTLDFEQNLQRNVLLLPMGACDDGAHSINEKLDMSNFFNGIKLYGMYLVELGKIDSQ